MVDDIFKKNALDYSWNYFKLHATQRMSIFYYFVVFASLMTTGLVTTLSRPGFNNVALVLSVLLIVLSFIFWKLDQRVRFLIKHSEQLLKKIEQSLIDQTDNFLFDLFLSEESTTNNMKKQICFMQISKYPLSYSRCFNFVFLVFAILGFLGFVFSTMKAINSTGAIYLVRL